MAEGVDIEPIVEFLLSGAGAIIAVVVLIGIGVGIYYIYEKQYRRYQQFKCIIWQKDGFGQLTQKYDNAGIFVDRDTKNKRLFLKKSAVGLNPDNIPYIPAGNTKIIYLLQTGLKNFRYIKPSIQDKFVTFQVGEEDVNWALGSYNKAKKLFAQSWIMQYLPFMLLAFVSLIILILFMYLFKQFGTIGSLIQEIQELAKVVAAAKSGTTVV